MRTFITAGNVKIEYPDGMVWLWDENLIRITAPGNVGQYRVGYECLVGSAETGEEATLNYRSQFSKTVTFSLNEALRTLYSEAGNWEGYNDFQVTLTIYLNETVHYSMTFNLYVQDGRTLPYKIHGGNKVVYLPAMDDLEGVYIWAPRLIDMYLRGNVIHLWPGINWLDLHQIITSPGVYRMCFQDTDRNDVEITGVNPITPTSATISLNYLQGLATEIPDQIIVPSIYEQDMLDDCIMLIVGPGMTTSGNPVCENGAGGRDGSFVELKYRDCDGCTRYLGGWIQEDKHNVERTMWSRPVIGNPMKQGFSHISSYENTLTISFIDVERASGFDEILLSENVWFRCQATNGQWRICKIQDSISRNSGDDRYDLTLEIKC